MIWVDIFKLGAEVHKGGRVVEITEGFVNSVVRNFAQLTREGAEVVVLREHERDGHVFGIVHAMRVMDGFVQASMEFFRREDRDAYNSGMLRRFSPGFALDFEHPHTGQVMGPTVLEVSFTAMPFQMNLRPPQEANPGVRLALHYSGDIVTPQEEKIMEDTPQTTEEVVEVAAEEPAEEVEIFDARAAFDALTEKVSALVSLLTPPEPTEAPLPLSDSEREIEELKATVRSLQDNNTRLELASHNISENVDTFLALKRVDPELYAETVRLHAPKPGKVQEPLGQPGVGEVSGELTRDAILELAREADCEPGSGRYPMWIAKNYPDRFDELV